MGKKNRKKKVVSASGKPTVSICTPTYNRRIFIPQLIKCFQKQTYPKQLMEWIVVDDGEDPVDDLFKGVECVKYFRVENIFKTGFPEYDRLLAFISLETAQNYFELNSKYESQYES